MIEKWVAERDGRAVLCKQLHTALTQLHFLLGNKGSETASAGCLVLYATTVRSASPDKVARLLTVDI